MEYSGRLTREQFLHKEIKIVAEYKLMGLDEVQIAVKILRENVFQYPTERMVKNITSVCLHRLKAMNDSHLENSLVQGPSDLSKQINLYAIMKREQLVCDFMTEIIGEKYRQQDLTLTKKDLNQFFMKLADKESTVATWTASTLSKVKQVLKRILVETGYIDDLKTEVLNPIFLYDELEQAMTENGDRKMLPAFNRFI